jgi:hypothetical protein
MNSEKSIVDLLIFLFFILLVYLSFICKNRFKGISLNLSDLHNLPRDNIKVSLRFVTIPHSPHSHS